MCLNGHKPYYPTPKMKFKIQQYQTNAVENTVAVFRGQHSHRMAEYRQTQYQDGNDESVKTFRELSKKVSIDLDYETENRPLKWFFCNLDEKRKSTYFANGVYITLLTEYILNG